MKKLIIFLSLILIISACGQKGPLYIEPKAENNQPDAEQSQPAPETKAPTETEKTNKDKTQK